MTPAEIAGGVVALVLGYVVGSLPLAVWIGRSFGVDIESAGDGNPGSANVWKLAGRRAGMLALAGDLLKGMVPTGLGWALAGFGGAWLGALGAILGHSWPVFGRRRGGRAVATFGGALILIGPIPALASIALLLTALAYRGRVAAIVVGIGSFPFLYVLEDQDPLHLAALGVLYLVTLGRYWVSRRAA